MQGCPRQEPKAPTLQDRDNQWLVQHSLTGIKAMTCPSPAAPAHPPLEHRNIVGVLAPPQAP